MHLTTFDWQSNARRIVVVTAALCECTLICAHALQVPLKIVYRDPPLYIHDQRLYHIYHRGDVAKMNILLEYGGIYLDYDVIVVNSLDPVRRYDATLGKPLTNYSLSLSVRFNGLFSRRTWLAGTVPECLHSGFYWC